MILPLIACYSQCQAMPKPDVSVGRKVVELSNMSVEALKSHDVGGRKIWAILNCCPVLLCSFFFRYQNNRAATTPRANNKNCVADNITGTFNQLSTQQALE